MLSVKQLSCCASAVIPVALGQPCSGAVQKVVLYVALLRAGECG